MPTPRFSPDRPAWASAARVLRDQWLITEATWSDSVRQRFEERYLAPWSRRSIRREWDSGHRRGPRQVRRDCSDRSETQ